MGGGIRNAAISPNFQFTNEGPVIMIIRKGCWIPHAGQITAESPSGGCSTGNGPQAQKIGETR